MNRDRPRPSADEWLRADQPGPPLTALFQQRRGLFLGALAVALLLVVIVVGERPVAPLAKPAAIGSASPTGMPFFGLFPVFAYDAGRQRVVLLNFRDQPWLWSSHHWLQAHPSVAPPRRTGAAVARATGVAAVLRFGGQAYARVT